MRVAVVLLACMVLLAAFGSSEGFFWSTKQKTQTPKWLTKQSLNDFNMALDKVHKTGRGRRDVSNSKEEVEASVVPTSAPSTSFWDKLNKGAKDFYNKAKDDAKTLADRLEENLGI